MLAEKRPDIKIVGDELHPLQKVQDFSPYVAKIKASGADTVITGNWSNDMLLLIKAGKDAGLKVNWYTYYGGGPGTVPPSRDGGVGTLKQVSERHKNVMPELDATGAAFHKRFPGGRTSTYWRARNMWAMFAAAAKKAKSNDPVKSPARWRAMKVDTRSATSRCARTITRCCSRSTSRRSSEGRRNTTRKARASAGAPTRRSTARRRRCRRPARWSGRSEAQRLD